MDPLVRGSLWLRRLGARVSGAAVAVLLGLLLVGYAAAEPGIGIGIAGGLLLLAAAVHRLGRRLGRIEGEHVTQLDLELFTHLLLVGYAAVLHAPGGLAGPYHPLVYGLAMLAAAFSRPWAAAGTVLFAMGLELALGRVLLGADWLPDVAPHLGLLGVFAALNSIVFRAEIARIRSLSRGRIESEIEKMRSAARSYRLNGVPASVGPETLRAPPVVTDEERLMRSGVDEIHQAVQFALELLRRALDLNTAALLWLDPSGERLQLQELSSAIDEIAPGPFAARDGIAGAALSRGLPTSLVGSGAAAHLPYYAEPPEVGAICAAPVLDHAQARGVLVVDRRERRAFGEPEEQLLLEATRYLLRAVENERVFIQLERAKSEQGKLYRATEKLAGASTEAAVIEAGVASAREIAAFDFAAVTLFDRQSGEHEICAVLGEDADDLVGQRFKQNAGLVSMVVANRHPLPYRGDWDAARQVVFTRRLTPPELPALLVLPLVVHERSLGTLVLGSQRRGAFGEQVRGLLEVLASHLAVSLANARMMARLEELATTDGMTGLYNKRSLIQLAEQKIRSAARFGKPLSVLVCDIDFFKKVNDGYGHDVGDVVIKGFGEILKRVKRDTDVVARFGGEEFVVVCEETDERGAALLAERIRSELESAVFHTDKGPLKVTGSVGVAPFPSAGADWEALFKATDEALYASKRGGRNRVTVWSPKLAGSSHAA
jgi:two-component system, cell cycle response regulator